MTYNSAQDREWALGYHSASQRPTRCASEGGERQHSQMRLIVRLRAWLVEL